jgi:hypothetical protein
VKIGPKGGEYGEYLEEMKRMKSDTTCLFEVNLDTLKHEIRENLFKTTRNIFDHNRLNITSSSVPSKHDYKPGGTLIMTQGNFKGRVIDSGSDALGRWTYQTLAGKANRNLTVVSAYQVCNQAVVDNSKVKTLTASAQQISILRIQGRDLSPRQAFIADLRKFMTEQRQKNNGIFIVGDFNELLDGTYDGITKLSSDFAMTDVMFHVLGHDEFATHITGSTRVDYAIADGWVAECILQACYEPFQFRSKGDHRPMIFDFDALLLFGNPTYRLHSPASREFSAKDTSCNRQYIEHRHAFLKSRNFATRLENLKSDWNSHTAEQMDSDHQRACKHAASKCKKKPNIAFVKKIADLRKKKNVLLRVITESLTGMSMSASIAIQVQDGHNF